MNTTDTLSINAVLADPLALARQADFPLGYVGLDIPPDLLAADGVFAAHLPWQTGRRTPVADRLLEDSFPGWARSVIEDWAAGEFDFMPYVIFTRGDDTTQRLYYYVCEMQSRGLARGPQPLMFDIARIPNSTSAAWTNAAVKHLANELQLTESALEVGVALTNQRREMMRKLAENRRAPGHFYERIARASLFAPLETLQLDLPTTLATARGRVLLSGSSPPDDRLHLAVEASGWSIDCDCFDRNMERLGSPVAGGDNPTRHDVFERIGRQAHASTVGPRAFYNRADHVLQQARRNLADAAIFWLIEEDEAWAWDLAHSRKALENAGLPCLVLTRRAWDCSDQPETEIAEFLAGLKS